jgi:ketosteroid isomerase-like protein
MRFVITAACLGAALLLAAGTARAQETRAAIDTANKGFMAAFARHDARGVAGYYSSTAEAFPPNAEIIRGGEGITKLWQGVMDSGIVASADLKTAEVHAEGNLAYEVGTYAMKTKDGKVADHGKYCVVWLKENGAVEAAPGYLGHERAGGGRAGGGREKEMTSRLSRWHSTGVPLAIGRGVG